MRWTERAFTDLCRPSAAATNVVGDRGATGDNVGMANYTSVTAASRTKGQSQGQGQGQTALANALAVVVGSCADLLALLDAIAVAMMEPLTDSRFSVATGAGSGTSSTRELRSLAGMLVDAASGATMHATNELLTPAPRRSTGTFDGSSDTGMFNRFGSLKWRPTSDRCVGQGFVH